jgi:hypothetical protein
MYFVTRVQDYLRQVKEQTDQQENNVINGCQGN